MTIPLSFALQPVGSQKPDTPSKETSKAAIESLDYAHARGSLL